MASSAVKARADEPAGYEAAVAAYLRQVVSSRHFPVFSKLARIILDGDDLDPR